MGADGGELHRSDRRRSTNLYLHRRIGVLLSRGDLPDVREFFNLSNVSIDPGSYILNAYLKTSQSDPYGHMGLAPDPDLEFQATFNMPVDSSSSTMQTFFDNETDNGSQPHDGVYIYTPDGGYSASLARDLLTVNHTPGTTGQRKFTMDTSSYGWQDDWIHLTAILTDARDPAEAPEPGVWGLCGLGLAGIVALRRRLA